MTLGAQRKEVLQAALGTRLQIAGFRFRRRIAPGHSGQPGPGFHRVSGNSPRSAGIGWRRSSYGVAGVIGDVDSSATRAVDRSYDPAPRGVNYRDTDRHGFFDSPEEGRATARPF
jgi:hypothetical protein